MIDILADILIALAPFISVCVIYGIIDGLSERPRI